MSIQQLAYDVAAGLMPRPRPTQKQKIKCRLRQGWTSIYELNKMAFQYHTRMFELRAEGYIIEKKKFIIDGEEVNHYRITN